MVKLTGHGFRCDDLKALYLKFLCYVDYLASFCLLQKLNQFNICCNYFDIYAFHIASSAGNIAACNTSF